MQSSDFSDLSTARQLIVIAGPTAVGKTTLAIEVAQHFNTVILSADSRQCYKELNIGVARPHAQELKKVPHYFIASHSVEEEMNAAGYESYALSLLDQLFATHPVIVLVGGTGLYIKALLEGLDPIPPVSAGLRLKIVSNFQTKGFNWLQEELLKKDPQYASQGETQNPQRMMRALEVVEATGQSILSYQTHTNEPRSFSTIRIGLELPREILYERINARVDAMIQAGLETEARPLVSFRHLNALQTVGYKELFSYFDGTISLTEAIDQVKQNTRHYAKRQLTWFKKQPGFHWINAATQPSILPFIQTLLSQEKK